MAMNIPLTTVSGYMAVLEMRCRAVFSWAIQCLVTFRLKHTGGASIADLKEHIKSCLKVDSGYGAFIVYALDIPLTDINA